MQGVRSKELESRCRLLAERLTESARIVDHDPSLALYRLQEHVLRSLNGLVVRRIALSQTGVQLQALQRALDGAIEASEGMRRALPSVERGCLLVKEAMQLGQALPMSNTASDVKRRSKSFHGQRPQKPSG